MQKNSRKMTNCKRYNRSGVMRPVALPISRHIAFLLVQIVPIVPIVVGTAFPHFRYPPLAATAWLR